jgi:hypothetical protein
MHHFQGFFHLFRSQDTHETAVLEHTHEGIIGNLIELLDHLALNIGLAGGAKNLVQTGSAQIMRNHFSDEADLGQQNREFAGCFRMRGLLFNNKAAQCNGKFRHAQGSSWIKRRTVDMKRASDRAEALPTNSA